MNILLADDHALFLDTLHHYIQRAQPQYRFSLASSMSAVVDILSRDGPPPDLCILDFKMPGMKGYGGLQELLNLFPDQAFAVMSGVAEPEDVQRILALRVMGFLPKTMPGRVMLQAIEAMLHGRKYIPYLQDAMTIMPSYINDEAPIVRKTLSSHNDNYHLTAREREVLKLLCEGKSNKDIAAFLNLKIVTIKLHVRGIFRKLNCDNRTRAALKAKEAGLFR